MNTFSLIVFLLSSLGAMVSVFFLLLGLFVKRFKKSRSKSLATLGIMFVLWVGSVVVFGVTSPENGSTPDTTETSDHEERFKAATREKAVSDKSADSGKEKVKTHRSGAEDGETAEGAETAGDKSKLVEDADDTKDTKDVEGSLAELEIHFIDVGQGDATLIMCDGSAMLIDAGENDKGTAVQLYLQKRGIQKLDYVIGTHPDSDHIGGLDVILTKFDCETIILPDKGKNTATYRDVVDAMYYKDYESTIPKVGDTYSLGDASFTIIAPNGTYEEVNNWSVGIRLVHGENSFVFTGDAEEAAEADMLQNGQILSADVLKVPHHGSKTSTTEEFLSAVNPTYAVISCGTDNSYGHPSASTMNALRSAGIKVFRTDEQGSIIAVSDGTNISFNCAPSETYKAGEGTRSADVGGAADSGATDAEDAAGTTSMDASTSAKYIINISTKKFHYASCSSVDDMNEENKLPSNESRDEIIAKGYNPCGRCDP